MSLTDAERAVLLTPCDCGHDLDDHGGSIPCWICEDEGHPDKCKTNFAALLVARVAVIVHERTTRST